MRLAVLFPSAGVAPGAAVHRFHGAAGPVAWPRDQGALLGAAGAWNLLWRLGCRPEAVTAARLGGPIAGDVLFASASATVAEADLRAIETWLTAGGTAVCAGGDDAWRRFLPERAVLARERADRPYAALAYRVPHHEVVSLVSPPGWAFQRFEGAAGSERSGDMALVHGERQTPARALVTPLADVPAVVRHRRFVFLNGDPFAALQAWLQGQESLEPWMAWRHRLFWLDELASFLGSVLEQQGVLPSERPGIKDLGPTTVVLRHDVDASRDTAYLDLERERGLPAVHGILKDKNTRFWVDRLRAHPSHETALHYNTLASSWLGRRLRDLASPGPEVHRPARTDVAGRGLLRQVRWARERGIGVETLHRHGSFLLYPEWVDALHHVFEQEKGVLGASSLFRGQVLRWGVDRVDGAHGTVGNFPDAQFPFWLPFRLAHAGQGGRMTRGWETTSVMEIEPELLAQMLDHRVPGVPQRVLTLGFHPAHAQRPTFAHNGSLADFRRILDVIQERGVEVRTLRDVYKACNRAAAPVALS